MSLDLTMFLLVFRWFARGDVETATHLTAETTLQNILNSMDSLRAFILHNLLCQNAWTDHYFIAQEVVQFPCQFLRSCDVVLYEVGY